MANDDYQQKNSYLFDETLLKNLDSENVEKIILNENFKLRPLEKNDYNKGFLQLLAQLTEVGDVSPERFDEIFNNMKNERSYYVTVIEDINTEKIIGSATLFTEHKFIRGGCLRGRIEDVVVDSGYRGQKLGIALISTLKSIAEYIKCYKLTLDCNDQMIPWYQKFGFMVEQGRSNFMTIRFH